MLTNKGKQMNKLMTTSLILGFTAIVMAEVPAFKKELNVQNVPMNKHGIVTKESAVDVNTTINRLENIIKKKGITLFNRINHAQNSRNTGASSVPDAELLIFGKPKVGLKMMSKDPRAGLDLPLKILAYEGKDGKVYVTYRDVSFYGQIYNLQGCKVHHKMSKILDKLSTVISKSPEDFKAFLENAKSKVTK